jgi:pheromone shutdown-related protein TraB
MEETIRFEIDNKEIIIIPTAHVSKKSAELVEKVILEEKPDTVCVELCPQRYEQMKQPDKFENMDIVKVIKNKKAMYLLANLVLSAYQKRMAKGLGINAGAEMFKAVELAEEKELNLVLADRSIQTTFSRIWHGMGFKEKSKVLFQLLMSLFENDELSEADLEELKSEDMLTAALSELSVAFPMLKKPLVDERDTYLAQKIRKAEGEKIVAVVGAAHVPGIKEQIQRDINIKELEIIPKKKKNKIIPWIIPSIILVFLIASFSLDVGTGFEQIIAWILWNGTLAAVGALLALAHPLTILTAFLVAPISSLNPLLAAGWFAGLTEAFIRKPSVKDLSNLSEDVMHLKGFWKNRVTRILLIIAFCNLGSVVGTLIGGSEIIVNFLKLI